MGIIGNLLSNKSEQQADHTAPRMFNYFEFYLGDNRDPEKILEWECNLIRCALWDHHSGIRMQNGLKTRQESQLTCSVEKGLEPPFILVSLNLREGRSWKKP